MSASDVETIGWALGGGAFGFVLAGPHGVMVGGILGLLIGACRG